MTWLGISADRRWRRRWDLSRLCWDTGCGIWQKRVGRRHGCWLSDIRADIAPPASRTPYKVHARCVRIWRPTAVWTQLTVGVCIGEKGSALMVHGGVRTLRLNAVYWRLKPYA